MKRFKDRKRYRLEGFDYCLPGFYFVTIVTFNRIEWLGEIEGKKVILSKIGLLAKKYFEQIPIHFENVKIDEFEIMPDHVHGIVEIVNNIGINNNFNNNVIVGTRHGEFLRYTNNSRCTNEKAKYKFLKPLKPNSLSLIINQYKGTVKRYCNQNGYEDFRWQSKFYDRIIRNNEELYFIRQYIRNNVIKHLNCKTIYEEFN